MTGTQQLWAFGSYELDARTRELLKDGAKQKLQEQPFQILCALLERSGEVVTRDELRRRLWPGDTFVDFDNGLNVAIAKLRHALNDRAERPEYIETLPRVGYRFLQAAKTAPVPAASAATAVAAAGANARGLVAGALAGAVAIGAFTVWLLVAKTPGHPVSAAPRPAVAIMGFRNLSARADQAWLSTALSEMLATELAAGEHFRIIPGESVARTKVELSLPDTESYAAGTLQKVRRSLGADYVLVGSYLNSGTPARRVRLDLRLQDAQSGETLAIAPADGSEEDLTSLVAQAGWAVRQKLAGNAASTAEGGVAHAAAPPNADSARLYAEGLNHLRHFDARGARDLLGQATAMDPNYAPAHAALSDAWSALGYAEVARSEAQKAWQLSARMTPEERLPIEARYRESNSEWEPAMRIYRRLMEQFPDNAEYGLRLAGAQINAGKAREALTTLETLHKLPAPLADDAAISFVKSQAYEKLGDFERAQASAAEAAVAAHNREAQVLEADARAMECRQLVQMSRLEPAAQACESARGIYTRTGDRLGLAASMAYLAAAYCNQGHIAEARELYTQALDIDREIGNARSDAQWALNGLAVLLLRQGDAAGARNLYQESLGMARQTGSRPDAVTELSNIASTYLVEGNLRLAREMFEQALKESRSIAAKAVAASVLNNLGHTLYYLGDLAEAGKMLEQAIEADRETGAKLEAADALSWLGRVRLAQGRWDEARQVLEQAIGIAGEIKGPAFEAQYRLARAELDLAQDRPAAVEGVIRNSLEVLRQAKAPDRELEARILLARTLLDEGKQEEARQEVGRAGAIARTSHRRSALLAYAICEARVSAISGRPVDSERALRRLEETAAEAGRQGYALFQLDARLGAGEIAARRSGAGARGILEKVQKDARAGGFESIARKAARTLNNLRPA